MIKGIFFDLDGTLVDTHESNFRAYQKALKDDGFELKFSDFKRSIGHQAKEFLPWFAPGLTEEQYAEISRRKADYYQGLLHLSKLNERMVAFMNEVSHLPLVLVTTAKQRNAQAVLVHHKLEKYFITVITAEDVTQAKPAPDAYLLALEKTGLTANEVLAFEDSDVGRRAAEAAGISVIMITSFNV